MREKSNYKTFRYKKADIGIFSESANEPMKAFDKGCRIMGLTRGSFSLIDLIHSVLKKTGPADVKCVTWSAGIKDVNQIKWMLDSSLIRSFTIITDHSYQSRQSKYAMTITDLFGAENIRTSHIHAKFTLISNEDYKVAISTSMNLNANKTCENFELNEGDEVFDFYNDFVNHITGSMEDGFQAKYWKVNQSLNEFFHQKKKKSSLFFGDE